MQYISESGRKRVHEHSSDQGCHWKSIFKPLAFLVFHSPFLIQSLAQSSHGKDIKPDDVDEAGYVQWLCDEGNGGLLNLLNVLLHICELRGVPNHPVLLMQRV
jgi:hypothetical protein